jgi:hypothetical protein
LNLPARKSEQGILFELAIVGPLDLNGLPNALLERIAFFIQVAPNEPLVVVRIDKFRR